MTAVSGHVSFFVRAHFVPGLDAVCTYLFCLRACKGASRTRHGTHLQCFVALACVWLVHYISLTLVVDQIAHWYH